VTRDVKDQYLLLLFPRLATVIVLKLHIIMPFYKDTRTGVFQNTGEGQPKCFSSMFEERENMDVL
jgi:hypothetical protein